MFLDFLWKKRRSNRTQSAVLGDSDETLMVLPTDTAAWVVAKFNEMTGKIDSLKVEVEMLRNTVRSRNSALAKIRDIARPYVIDTPPAKRAFAIASHEVQELPA